MKEVFGQQIPAPKPTVLVAAVVAFGVALAGGGALALAAVVF